MLKTYSCSKGPGLCIVMSCDSESNVTSLTICVCACVYHIYRYCLVRGNSTPNAVVLLQKVKQSVKQRSAWMLQKV